jgi:hypothetical protein
MSHTSGGTSETEYTWDVGAELPVVLENAQVTCGFCNRSKGARPAPVNAPPGQLGPWPWSPKGK